MRAWTVDADDIQIADDFDATLLHRTPWIDDFLTHGRDEKFIVIATKGFGKTLLLKAKRIALRRRSARVCLPENSLLDKPIGDKIFSADMIALYGQSTDSWCKRLADRDRGRDAEAPRDDRRPARSIRGSHALLGNANLHERHRPLRQPARLRRATTSSARRTTPTTISFRGCAASRTPVAIFIDSIDEYFNKHIKHAGVRAPSDAGELSPDVWYFSQMGLVEVAYQLRRINHHLKVFASIRKEAFAKLRRRRRSMVQQYRGSTIDISLLASRACARSSSTTSGARRSATWCDPAQLQDRPDRGVSRAATRDAQPTRGEREDVFDYVYRHTLRRPRDFMTIGQKLSDLAPDGARQARAS